MKKLLLACIPTAVRRSRTCVLLLALATGISTVSVFALPTPKADTDYLFVPGHGVTRRTTKTKTFANAITEATAINGNSIYRVKIGFIEEAYTWKEMQPDNATLGNINITRLAADLQTCHDAGLRLRVLLSAHKYKESFPLWVWDPAHPDVPSDCTRQVSSGTNTVPIVELNNNGTCDLLIQFYDEVIRQLKLLPADLRDTFYGFVLQEPSLGEQGEFSAGETDDWFDNLKLVHVDLAANLVDFSATGKKHRLFWQMINYPDAGYPNSKTTEIVDAMPAGGGLCGPDTFPGEPHPKNNPPLYPLEWGLAHAYEEIRQASQNHDMPTSLHVYALNYNKPYQGGPFVYPANQPIYGVSDSDNDNGLNTPDGIVNFLGCVPTPHAESLKVNNVVWSIADGEDNTDDPGHPWTGWSRVKNWMKDTDTSKTPSGFTGGCNAYTPNSLH